MPKLPRLCRKYQEQIRLVHDEVQFKKNPECGLLVGLGEIGEMQYVYH